MTSAGPTRHHPPAADRLAGGSGDRGSDRQVRRQALSIGAATGAYGISFGALATTAGLDLAQAMVLSLLMFTGGSQFAFVGVVAGGGGAGAAIATSALLGARNTLYGLRLASLLGFAGWRRVAAAHVTIDESTAVAVAQPAPSWRPLRPSPVRGGRPSGSEEPSGACQSRCQSGLAAHVSR